VTGYANGAFISLSLGPRQIRKDDFTMSTVRYMNKELRKRKGRVDHAKVNGATEEQIVAWKLEDGIDDDALAPIRVVPPVTDLPALRERLKLSQEQFAERYLLSLRTVQEWEQHRREPSEAARVLLYAISQDPSGVARILRSSAA